MVLVVKILMKPELNKITTAHDMVGAKKPLKNSFMKSSETTDYCDNQFCESEAIKKVSVSVRSGGDSERKFCGACYEAYIIGMQHGRISENPSAYRILTEKDPSLQTYREK
jgi:hypothetical protein